MAIVGSDAYKSRPYWTNQPLYRMKDCRCGATQFPDREVYVMFVGGNTGFWVARCHRCGYMVCGETQEEAVKIWNGGEYAETNSPCP